MKNSLWLVTHTSRTEGCNESISLGYFSSRKNAERVVQKYRKKRGFRNSPKGFRVRRFVIDTVYCARGFRK